MNEVNFNVFTFRGKRKNCNWVFGSLIQKEGVFYIAQLDKFMGTVLFVVDEETIGQCTGLHDKNGKMAFAGDILEIILTGGEPYRSLIAWDKRTASFHEKSGWDMHFHFPIDRRIVGRKRIVGNIYDNKKLLKGQV